MAENTKDYGLEELNRRSEWYPHELMLRFKTAEEMREYLKTIARGNEIPDNLTRAILFFRSIKPMDVYFHGWTNQFRNAFEAYKAYRDGHKSEPPKPHLTIVPKA